MTLPGGASGEISLTFGNQGPWMLDGYRKHFTEEVSGFWKVTDDPTCVLELSSQEDFLLQPLLPA